MTTHGDCCQCKREMLHMVGLDFYVEGGVVQRIELDWEAGAQDEWVLGPETENSFEQVRYSQCNPAQKRAWDASEAWIVQHHAALQAFIDGLVAAERKDT